LWETAAPKGRAAAQAAARKDRDRDWLLHRVLVLSDVAGLSLAFVLAQLLFQPGVHVRDIFSPGVESILFILSLPLWVAAAKSAGLYSRDHTRTDHSTVDDFVGVVAVITVGSWVYACIAWSTHGTGMNPPRMISFWAMAIGFVLVARIIGRTLARRSPLYVQNAIVVGAGHVGQLIGRKLIQSSASS
jgi:FlaA1/EpsC-like NDP-sugar epimerase